MEFEKAKQQYQRPVLEIKKIDKKDILTASGNELPLAPGEDE